MAILSSRGHSCCSFYALPHNNRIPRKQGLSNVSGDIFGESSKAFRSCNILNWDKLKSQLTKPKMTMTMKVNVQLGKTWLRSQLYFSEEWKIKYRFSSKKAKKYFVPLFEDQTELETLWCEKMRGLISQQAWPIRILNQNRSFRHHLDSQCWWSARLRQFLTEDIH